ncbi:inositol polyphosphate multikinase, partial [Haematococcus lacustris]
MSTDHGLRLCEHQVGGHMTKESKPDTLVDDAGRFYKPYQGDARSAREVAFYQLDLMGLRAFVPRMFGTAEVAGRQYCVMEDVCHGYLQPCVLDVKMGFVTQYAWATDAYREKAKDQATTQSSMGFRISGLQVYSQQEGEMKKMGRSWGKTLTQDTLHQAFTLFADNGALTPGQVWAPTSPAIVRLQQLLAWLEQQTSFCFFQGTATSLDTANLQVHFIDFAHTFPTPRTPDLNVLTALQSLLALLAKLSDQR